MTWAGCRHRTPDPLRVFRSVKMHRVSRRFRWEVTMHSMHAVPCIQLAVVQWCEVGPCKQLSGFLSASAQLACLSVYNLCSKYQFACLCARYASTQACALHLHHHGSRQHLNLWNLAASFEQFFTLSNRFVKLLDAGKAKGWGFSLLGEKEEKTIRGFKNFKNENQCHSWWHTTAELRFRANIVVMRIEHPYF